MKQISSDKGAPAVNTRFLGTAAMLAASLCFSTGGLLIKLIPWNPLAINGVRNLIACLVIGLYIRILGHRLKFNLTVLMGAVSMAGVTTLFAMANKLTTAANAIVLQFTAPVFIVLYSAVLYKKEIRKEDLAVVLVVLAGIALFFFDKLGPSTAAGNCVAILAGMFMAGMFMGVERLQPEERFSAIVIGQAFAFLVGLPAVILTKPVMNATTVSSILILGVFQLGLSYVLYVKASETCPALACCLLSAAEPLLNPIWVMIFDGEKPGIFALIGGIIVITAVTVWTIWDGKQKELAEAAGRESP